MTDISRIPSTNETSRTKVMLKNAVISAFFIAVSFHSRTVRHIPELSETILSKIVLIRSIS